MSHMFPFPGVDSGRVLFTGPDGSRDYKAPPPIDCTYVGIGEPSNEISTSVGHIFNSHSAVDPLKRRHQQIGEVGFDMTTLFRKPPSNPIVHGEFRTYVENKQLFHRYQDPFYPSESDEKREAGNPGWPSGLRNPSLKKTKSSRGQHKANTSNAVATDSSSVGSHN